MNITIDPLIGLLNEYRFWLAHGVHFAENQ